MTSSIPFKAVTREIVDAIHTRTTVLTSVIYTVINVCKFDKNKGNKGRCKESTIRGHRKNLIPRWDSNPRRLNLFPYKTSQQAKVIKGTVSTATMQKEWLLYKISKKIK